MAVNDVKLEALQDILSKTGSISDLEREWLASIVDPYTGSIPDMWRKALVDAGYDEGSIIDRINLMMSDLGHTGSISDRWLKYWTDTPGQGVGFDLFVDFARASGGSGLWTDKYSTTALTALGSLPDGTRVGFVGSMTDGSINPRIALSGDGLFFGQAGNVASVIKLTKIISSFTSLGSNKWRAVGVTISDGSASGNVFYDGVPMILVQNTGALTTDGQALVTAWGWNASGITATTSPNIDIYSSVDPNTLIADGHVYSHSAFLNLFDLSGEDCVVEDFEAFGALHEGGNIRMTGQGSTVRRATIKHGSRHGSYFGANPVIEDCLYIGGRCRQGFGTADHIVVNQNNFGPTDGAIIRRTRFEGDTYLVAGSDSLSSLYAHDSGGDGLNTVVMDECEFGARMKGFAPSALTTTLTNPVFDGAWQIVTQGLDTAIVEIEGATGDVGSLLGVNNSSGTLTFSTEGCDLELTGANFTGPQHFQIRQEGGGQLVWNSTGDVLECTDPTGTLRYVTLVNKLNLAVNGSSFPGTWDKMFAVYGTMNFTGDHNTYKSGADKFETPAGNDNSLAAWKTRTGQDTSSTATA